MADSQQMQQLMETINGLTQQVNNMSQNMESRFATGEKNLSTGMATMEASMQQGMQAGLKKTEDDIRTALGRVDGTMDKLRDGISNMGERIDQANTDARKLNEMTDRRFKDGNETITKGVEAIQKTVDAHQNTVKLSKDGRRYSKEA